MMDFVGLLHCCKKSGLLHQVKERLSIEPHGFIIARFKADDKGKL